MKAYLVSLAIGVLVGVIYGLLHVRSPAPPVVALVGLLGMLLGEQLVSIARNLIAEPPPGFSELRERCVHHGFRCSRSASGSTENTEASARRDDQAG